MLYLGPRELDTNLVSFFCCFKAWILENLISIEDGRFNLRKAIRERVSKHPAKVQVDTDLEFSETNLL